MGHPVRVMKHVNKVDKLLLSFPATLDQLLQQENVVIEYWTVKKRKLEQCHQYVLFEQSAKQALDWIHDSGEAYLSTHTSVGETREETDSLLKEYYEFRGRAKVSLSAIIISFFIVLHRMWVAYWPWQYEVTFCMESIIYVDFYVLEMCV